jgi:hypothetical protein
MDRTPCLAEYTDVETVSVLENKMLRSGRYKKMETITQ